MHESSVFISKSYLLHPQSIHLISLLLPLSLGVIYYRYLNRLHQSHILSILTWQSRVSSYQGLLKRVSPKGNPSKGRYLKSSYRVSYQVKGWMKEKDPNKIPKGKIQMKVRDFALCSFGWSLFHHSLPPFFFVLFSFPFS